MTNKQNTTTYIDKNMPNELQDFNWGAFLLTFIWGFKYKAWITFCAIPLILIQLPLGLNWLLLIIFQFYCGYYGNKWAYKHKWWQKPSDFNKEQTKWAIASVSISILIPFITLSVLGSFLTKNTQNPKEYIANALCAITYNKIKKAMPMIQINQYTSSESLAKQFGQNFNKTKTSGNIVLFKINKGIDNDLNAYSISFEKPEGEICTLKDQNCYIYSEYIQATDMDTLGECTFYFDNFQNIKPNSKTQQSIKKGLNLFNYL